MLRVVNVCSSMLRVRNSFILCRKLLRAIINWYFNSLSRIVYMECTQFRTWRPKMTDTFFNAASLPPAFLEDLNGVDNEYFSWENAEQIS